MYRYLLYFSFHQFRKMICFLSCRFHSLGDIAVSTFAKNMMRKIYIKNKIVTISFVFFCFFCINQINFDLRVRLMKMSYRYSIICILKLYQWIYTSLTICLSKHFLLFTYFRQNSQIYTMDKDVNSWQKKRRKHW